MLFATSEEGTTGDAGTAESEEGTSGESRTAESVEGMIGTIFAPGCITGLPPPAGEVSARCQASSTNHSREATTEKPQSIQGGAAATTTSQPSENATHADTETVLAPAGQVARKQAPHSRAATTGENRPPQSMTG